MSDLIVGQAQDQIDAEDRQFDLDEEVIVHFTQLIMTEDYEQLDEMTEQDFLTWYDEKTDECPIYEETRQKNRSATWTQIWAEQVARDYAEFLGE